jgi:hypothetical protein
VYTCGRGLLRGWWWPDGNISPGNYGWLFVVLYLLFKLKLIQ